MGRRRRIPPFPLRIERLEPGGLGAGQHEQSPVLVRGAPPGCKVQVRPFRRKRGVIHGRRTALLEPAPDAVTPRCALFGLCGGCVLQELDLPAQRREKEAMARRGAGDLESVRLLPIVGADAAYGYRNRVELTYGTRCYLSEEDMAAGLPIEGRHLGFHAAGRYDRVTDTARCELISEGLNAVLGAAREQLAASAFEPWDVRAHTGFWRHLLLRESALGQRLVVLFTAPPAGDGAAELAELQRFAAALPEVHGVVWMVNPSVADAALGEQRAVLRGQAWLEERLGGLVFRLSPTSFFQTNTAGAEVLYQQVAQAAGEGKHLLDLYCGSGSIGLSLAQRFAQVTGVELHQAAVDDARANADRNGIANAVFHCGEVERVAEELGGDVVVADPPRAGLHPRAARWLASLQARRLVYVACHPPSLGRDRLVLEAGGWRLQELRTVDLFPQTGHIEAVALFER